MPLGPLPSMGKAIRRVMPWSISFCMALLTAGSGSIACDA